MILDERIKVLIVDDYANVRQGLLALIETTPDIIVVGEAVDEATAVKKALALHPDVVVMDLIKPGMDGTEVIEAIKQEIPQARILVLTNNGDEQRVLSAFQSGAQGYLLKDAVLTNVVDAIRDVHDGKLTLHPNLTDGFMHAIQEPPRG